MSYILDALRRADAERERGHVPSIHSQNPTQSQRTMQQSQGKTRSPWLWLALAGLGAALFAAVYVWRSSSDTGMPAPVANKSPAAFPPSMATAVAEATQAASPVKPPDAAVATTPAPSSNVVTQPVTATTAPRPRAEAAAPSTQPSPSDAMPQRAPTPARVAQANTAARPATTPSAAGPKAQQQATTQTPQTEDVIPRNQLPNEVQRQLPPLAMSGSVYSPQARNRMVIVDGRLVMEGEQATQDILVERIQPKSVILRFQGYRFSVPL